jgi:diguanylate cyclase (GGDEF)-like protein/PAS domain S-box-containing protein
MCFIEFFLTNKELSDPTVIRSGLGMFERFGCLAAGDDLLLVALACLNCLVASVAVLGFFQGARATLHWGWFTASVVLTLAILVQHFTQQAVDCAPDRAAIFLSSHALSLAVIGVTIAMAAVAMIAARRLAVQRDEFARERREFERARLDVIQQFEATARRHELTLKTAVENMNQGLCLFDRDMRLVISNRRYAEMFGIAPDFMRPGISLREVAEHRIALGQYPGKDPQRFIQSWFDRVARGQPSKTLLEFETGGVYSISHEPTPDGGWVVTYEDVTERLRAEGELSRTRESLAAAKTQAEQAMREAQTAHARLRDAFEAIPAGLVLFDAEDRFVLWNKCYIETRESQHAELGMRYEDTLRMSLARGEIADATGREEEWLKERLARHDAVDTDYVGHRKGDRWIRIKETRTSDGGRIGMRIDITDLKRSEESFRLLLEKNPIPMWVYDNETLRFLAVNDAAVSHYGYSREAFRSMSVLDLRRPGDRLHRPGPADRARRAATNAGRVRTHVKSDGTEMEIAIYAKDLPFEGHNASVVVAVDVTEQRQAERRLAHYARHDPLTNLGNRMALSEQIESSLARMRKTNEPFAVFCIDLDRFKDVNDGFGHSMGDDLLREVARRFQSTAGDAFVGRIGGDEFALVTSSGTNPAMAARLAGRIQSALGDSFEIREQSLQIGVSIGIASSPADGEDELTLLRNADAALYRAKNDGRGVTHFFRPEMDLQLRERHATQRDLRIALNRDELLLHYQPQARIGGEIFGFEALVRWPHQRRGMIGPEVFIRLAEENGLIVQIGEWVLREACREAASWPNPLTVAVNLSPIQFRSGDLVGLVRTVLNETGLPANRLELEVTEGVMLSDHGRALAILRRIKALGVQIAMDDFGSGYSSLSYLQSFPFDKLKIDRSFVANLGRNTQSAAIIRAVIGLGRGLQLPIIAEGVETEEQLAFLTRESCDAIQGYLLGYPLPIADYAAITGRSATDSSLRRTG